MSTLPSNERLRFEVWAQKEGFAVPGYDLNNGRYFDEAFHWMWFAWKSRAETHAHETGRLLPGEDIAEALEHQGDPLSLRAARHIRIKWNTEEGLRQQLRQTTAQLNGEHTQKAVEQPSPVDDAEFGTTEWRAANPESEGGPRG